MKRPLCFGILILGISVMVACLNLPLTGVFLIPLFLMPVPFIFKKIKTSQGVFLIFLYFLGIVITQNTFTGANEIKPFYEKSLEIQGIVEDISENKSDGQTLRIKTQSITIKGKLIKREWSLNVRIPDLKLNIKPGDILSIKGKASKPQGQRNPGGFDYALFLNSKGIDGLFYGEELEIVGKDNGLIYQIQNFRRTLEEQSKKYLSENTADLLNGILFGGKSIQPETKLNFQNAGIAHVLSVSGLHVGYIFLCTTFLLKAFHIKKKHWILFLIPALIFYSALTGFSPSVIRASIMLGSLTLGKGLHLEKDSLNNLALAGIIILLIWPTQLFQAGFQLSFSGVLGIVLFYEPLLFQYKKYFCKNKEKKDPTSPMISGLILTMCTTLGTVPVMLYHFKSFTLMSFLSNLIMIPIIGFFLIFGIIFLVLSTFSGPLGIALGTLLNILGVAITSGIWGINELGSIFKFHRINRGGFNLIELGLFIFMAFGISGYFYLRNPKIKKTLVLLGGVLVSLWLILPLFPKDLRVTFLDVGQGDSILIETPKGVNYLIDGGGYYNQRESQISDRVLLPVLYSKNINHLNGVFISHTHADHQQGIEELVEKGFPIDHLFMSIKGNNEKLMTQKNIPVTLLKKGSVIETEDGVKLEVLSPSGEVKPIDEEDQNNHSLVIRLTYGENTLLLCGDIEKETEEKLIKEPGESQGIETQVLKIPHHGSLTSTTDDFLKKTNPTVAIISVGGNNTFSHPRDEVIERLENHGIKILRTDINGAIAITCNGRDLSYKTYGEQ